MSTGLSHGEIDPIEITMEPFLNLLRPLEFRPRFFNAGIARESLQQNGRFFSAALSCFSPATENAVGKTLLEVPFTELQLGT
jgi:hypothetical protein